MALGNVMNCCEECIVYQIQNNKSEIGLCENCGNETMEWKLEEFGTPHLKCSKCGYSIGVDLNTPCELDHAINKKYQIEINPSDTIPNPKVLKTISKLLGINILQARNIFVTGYKAELEIEKIAVLTDLLNENYIMYKTDGYENPRLKYHFYKECKYPYSHMRFCLEIDKKE